MSRNLFLSCLFYLLVVLIGFLFKEPTAVASTGSLSLLTTQSVYIPPPYTLNKTTVTAINSSYLKEKKVFPENEINSNGTQRYFQISGYNSVPEQTDSTPCIPASGDNICGMTNIVACPRVYPLGTKFIINGDVYTCLDRLSEKYDGRIDIFFDKDITAALDWGVQYKLVTIVD